MPSALQLTLWGGEEDADRRPTTGPSIQLARQVRERHYLELVETALAVRRYLRSQSPTRFASAANCSHQQELEWFADRIDFALARHRRELHDRLAATRAQQQDSAEIEHALDSLEACMRIDGVSK